MSGLTQEMGSMKVKDGRRRVVIEGVRPEIDCGRFPAKRTIGERVVVEADVFTDGHEGVAAALRFRRDEDRTWEEVRMQPLANDRWRGSFVVSELGSYRYTIRAWLDLFTSWADGLQKKVEDEQDVSVDLLVGAELVATAAHQATGEPARRLRSFARELLSPGESAVAAALDPELADLMAAYPDRRLQSVYARELQVLVDRERARFGAWYELFPRSASPEPGRHGTFADVEKRLPYVAGMGFDVLYLPPIHPIGHTHRKGKNNRVGTDEEDPGSPWAIGSEEGGHKAVHRRLGTLSDFERLVQRARDHGLEIALDLAFQCSPDHPYVRQHPAWFRLRPDGTIRYAENPPKKYQDIYPLDFETEDWAELWEELKSVVQFWVDHGVRIFRVDNPHTKPFAFWEWLIEEIRRDHPDVLFLAEAFTRPKVMYRLAKLGFNQSYTYFAWRNTKQELTDYFTELTLPPVRDFFRPNLWPNTPDILTEHLQTGGSPAFMARLVLAATLGASYGIYGPAFELQEHQSIREGSEEYLDSEKYEIRRWDLKRSDSLAEFIGRVNKIRHDNPALHIDHTLRFHPIDNDRMIAYSKASEDGTNAILVVVNLDPHHRQAGWTDLDLEVLGLKAKEQYQVHDLLTEARFVWNGGHNFVELNPHVVPAHVFRIRSRVRREHDFEYFM
jgi:starch synthase (maltosyl-transferring)